jgi:LPXTG-motif cell wall-anchored protein
MGMPPQMQDIPAQIPQTPEEWKLFGETFYYIMAGLGVFLGGLGAWFKFFRKKKEDD